MRSLFFVLSAAALLLSTLAPSKLVAADAPPAKPQTPGTKTAPATDADSKQPRGATLYDLPAGDDTQRLVDFIRRISDFEPNTAAETREYNTKAQPAVEAAAQKILKLEKDPHSALAKQARMILLNIRINHVDTLDPKQQRELVDTVLKSLEGAGLEQNNLRLAMSLATSLEYGGNPPLAGEAYAGLAKTLAASDNADLREMAKKFEGAHRRLTSVGKPLEITGAKTVDGKPFDWAKYRGKVVLVDFWATWCGPCVAELPNVRKNYEKYHAQGFDVVGVSIDEDHDALVAFLEKSTPPWVNLQDGASADATKSSLADHYGIFGIPATFLVDKEGNVISTQARGETLAPQIEKALAAGKKTTGK